MSELSSLSRSDSGSERRESKMNSREVVMAGLFAMPLLLLFVVFAWGGATELRDRSKVNRVASEIDDWNAVRSVERSPEIDGDTSREHAATWDSIFRSMDRFEDDIDDMVEAYTTLTPPEQSWSAEPYAKRKALESQWMDRQRDEMRSDPTPGWQSKIADGGNEWYSPSYLLLERDANVFRVAYHEGDHDEAMKVLLRMNQTIAAMDSSLMMHRVVRWTQHQRQVMPLVRDSVRFSFWSDEDLERLRSMVSTDWQIEQMFSQRVKATLASRLEFLQKIDRDNRGNWDVKNLRPLVPLGVSSTHIADVLDSQRRVLSVPQAGTWEHVRRVREIESQRSRGSGADASISLVAIPFARSTDFPLHPGSFALARNLARLETERRWTVTAIAIRQYRNQFEKWPDRLTQLSRVGLTADQWCFEPGKPFGYQISRDGSEARLWTPDVEDYLSNPNVNELRVDDRYLPTKRGSQEIEEDRIVRLQI